MARGAERVGAAACDPLGTAPSRVTAECAGLVGSLAVRMGIVTAGAVVLMALLSVGLHRTAVRLAELRGQLAGPAG